MRTLVGNGFGWGLGQFDIETSGEDYEGRFLSGDFAVPYKVFFKIGERHAAQLDDFDGDLNAAICAYNAGASNVRAALSRGQDPNSVTTGKNYASDILSRAVRYGLPVSRAASATPDLPVG